MPLRGAVSSCVKIRYRIHLRFAQAGKAPADKAIHKTRRSLSEGRLPILR